MSQAQRIRPGEHHAVRVVLVDDHALVRQGVRSVLEAGGEVRVVGEGGDGREALEAVVAQRPDVVVLDLRLGEEDGVEIARACRSAVPETKVLVLSAHGGSTELRRALAAGADGYLLKGVTAAELADGILRVAEGETVIDPLFVPELLEHMADGRDAALPTLREMQVLALSADGLTTDQAAARLGLSARTVQKHVENLYRKLGVSNRAELVQQAFRRGLIR